MTPLRWLITLPLAIVLVVFAVNNRQAIEVSLWPFDILVVWPAFVFVLVPAALAFLLGGLAAWLAGHGTRRLARQRRHRIEELERQVASLEKRIDDAGAQSPRVPAPVAPPARQE